MSEFVSVEKKGKIAFLTITREKALNALNQEVLLQLKDAFLNMENDKDIYAIILTGEGRSFVAGADIGFMQNLHPQEARDFIMFGQSVMNHIERIEKPIIAAVNGFALGGGCELALACDIILASEKAIFGQPEVTLGIIPGFGGTQRLARRVGSGMAKYLIYSAENIDANEAYRIGLAEKVYSLEDLLFEAEKIANKIASKAPIAVKMAKAAMGNGAEIDIRTAVQIEAESIALCFSTKDQKEGMTAFVEKRKADFKNE
jgi:enoyl-CoA hydratase